MGKQTLRCKKTVKLFIKNRYLEELIQFRLNVRACSEVCVYGMGEKRVYAPAESAQLLKQVQCLCIVGHQDHLMQRESGRAKRDGEDIDIVSRITDEC